MVLSRAARFVALSVALVSLAACSPTIRTPHLLHPGPASFQRYNAGQFDPYPPNDLAPPISGGRPIDMQTPRNEVTRARQHLAGERPLTAPGPVRVMTPIGAPATYPTTVPTIPTIPATSYPTTYPTPPPALPPISSPRY